MELSELFRIVEHQKPDVWVEYELFSGFSNIFQHKKSYHGQSSSPIHSANHVI